MLTMACGFDFTRLNIRRAVATNKNYRVEGDRVSGENDSSGLSDKYSRSVKFVGAIIK